MLKFSFSFWIKSFDKSQLKVHLLVGFNNISWESLFSLYIVYGVVCCLGNGLVYEVYSIVYEVYGLVYVVYIVYVVSA